MVFVVARKFGMAICLGFTGAPLNNWLFTITTIHLGKDNLVSTKYLQVSLSSRV